MAMDYRHRQLTKTVLHRRRRIAWMIMSNPNPWNSSAAITICHPMNKATTRSVTTISNIWAATTAKDHSGNYRHAHCFGRCNFPNLMWSISYSGSSNNDDDVDNSIHSHTAPPFLMGAENKLFSTPGSFNFSMAALADPATLAGMHHNNSISNGHFIYDSFYCNMWLIKSISFFAGNFYWRNKGLNHLQSAAELAGSPQGKIFMSV